MDEIKPCPMCGSPAELESSGAIECYGRAWQTVLIGCDQEKDNHCGMSLSLEADLFNIRNSEKQLVTCWNGLERV